MNNETYLKKPNGEIMGRLVTESSGSIRLYNWKGLFLGEFRNGSTYKYNGELVGTGNLLPMLLVE